MKLIKTDQSSRQVNKIDQRQAWAKAVAESITETSWHLILRSVQTILMQRRLIQKKSSTTAHDQVQSQVIPEAEVDLPEAEVDLPEAKEQAIRRETWWWW